MIQQIRQALSKPLAAIATFFGLMFGGALLAFVGLHQPFHAASYGVLAAESIFLSIVSTYFCRPDYRFSFSEKVFIAIWLFPALIAVISLFVPYGKPGADVPLLFSMLVVFLANPIASLVEKRQSA